MYDVSAVQIVDTAQYLSTQVFHYLQRGGWPIGLQVNIQILTMYSVHYDVILVGFAVALLHEVSILNDVGVL